MENMEKPGGKNDNFSIFAEKFEEEMKKVKAMEMQVIERWKFIEAEEAAGRVEAAAKVREEIKALEAKITASRNNAMRNLVNENISDTILKELDSDKMPQA